MLMQRETAPMMRAADTRGTTLGPKRGTEIEDELVRKSGAPRNGSSLPGAAARSPGATR